MKTNEILNKVTLEFAGGGKLDLSDYGPYIVNGEDEVEEISSNNDSKFIEQIPDLYKSNNDEHYYTYEQLIEYISNKIENTIESFTCLYKNEPNLNEHIYMYDIDFSYNDIYPITINFSKKNGGFSTDVETIENESYYSIIYFK